jgi:hypothetical protein
VRLNANQRRTLERIFSDPVQANIAWVDIESLFRACGAELSEGRGSRVRVRLHDVKAVFHRPHPRREAAKGTVSRTREFLRNAGIVSDV